MANIRRHFNFSAKPSTMNIQIDAEDSSSFDKHSLMNNICSCLDICCSYIQTLNALCGAGSLLARNLLQTVQNAPSYKNVAQQFLCIWDEVGKATAGASAAVKTETLMMLQEVLNNLEDGNADNGIDNSLVDTFQVIGSCLHSFIELQAQFSMSTWKSLSKLSKNFSNDAFIHSRNWKSHDRNTLKATKNSELCSTIKKHYSHLLHKYETPKTVEPAEVPQSQFYITPGVVNSHLSQSEASKNESASTVVWSPSTMLWSMPKDVQTETPLSSTVGQIPALSTAKVVAPPELDEVINLLSCMPFDQLPAMNNTQSSSNTANYDCMQQYQIWPSGSAPAPSRYLNQQRPWSEGSRDINFGYNSWLWRTDNMNCSDLPSSFQDIDSKDPNKNSWQNAAMSCRWSVGAGESSSDDISSNQGPDSHSCHSLFSRPRRYSSSDGLPDTLENVPDAENRFWNTQSHKTSTWPLKQSSSKLLTDDWPDDTSASKPSLSEYYLLNS